MVQESRYRKRELNYLYKNVSTFVGITTRSTYVNNFWFIGFILTANLTVKSLSKAANITIYHIHFFQKINESLHTPTAPLKYRLIVLSSV